ncbi:MAG: hypothetical protein ACLP9K_05565 [Nitrososphaerales archaeon]
MGNRTIAIVLVALLIAPGLTLVGATATTRTVGVAAGDEAVYSFLTHRTFYGVTYSVNITQDVYMNETIQITSLNLTAPAGYFAYTGEIANVTGGTVSSSKLLSNTSTIFDPYDNNSYLGLLGFFPVIYTNVLSGNDSFQIAPTINGTKQSAENVTVWVIRTPTTIGVNFTVKPFYETPWRSVNVFNATSGVLEKGAVYTNFFQVEKYFYYTLLSYAVAKPGPSYTPYLELLALGVIAVLVAVTFLRRKSGSERKTARIREKLR